jgi:hypothetical protein
MWCYKDTNFDEFRNNLDQVDWEECIADGDPDTACDLWTKKLLEVVDTSIPHKDVTVRHEGSRWYNGYLRKLCRIQRRDHKYWTKHKTDANREKYKTSRNKYIQEVERLKREYEEKQAKTLADEVKTNPKRWWTIAKDTMGKTKNATIPSMVSNNEVYDSDYDKAKLFNDYFLEVQSLPNAPPEELPEEPPSIQSRLEHLTIQEKDVNDILLCLNVNKAYGPDGIGPKILKEGRPSLVKILTKIFNLSLSTGIFPSQWKWANVCPIYKKAEEFFTSNYRPISLLNTIAKVFE